MNPDSIVLSFLHIEVIFKASLTVVEFMLFEHNYLIKSIQMLNEMVFIPSKNLNVYSD